MLRAMGLIRLYVCTWQNHLVPYVEGCHYWFTLHADA